MRRGASLPRAQRRGRSALGVRRLTVGAVLAAALSACGDRAPGGDTARDTTLVAPPSAPTGSLAVPNPDSLPAPGESTGATAASVPPDSVENTSRGPSGPTPLPMPRP